MHNRWHPDIPPELHVEPGETFTLETRDGLDGQLPYGSTGDDLLRIALGRSHPLSGPVYVDGAAPGDVLAVEILEVQTASRGVTPVLPGFGLLEVDEPVVVSWEIDDGNARSPSLPGIAVPGDPFPGVVGVAPASVVEEDDAPDDAEPFTGLRTIPPRTNGGNLDVRGLGAGAVLYLSVQVPGALLSVGDVHFAQGDGEVCGAAIEVSGSVTLRASTALGARPLTYVPAPRPSRPSFATIGIATDVREAARKAVESLVAWLVDTRGFDRGAAYVLCSVAADLSISEIVNAPHPLVSALLPLDVFEDH